MTAVGALPILFTKRPNHGVRDLALGFAAGVMLAASFFSLIIPSLEASELRYGGSVVPAAIACAAILLGIGMVALLNELLPHEHFEQGREGPEAAYYVVSGCLLLPLRYTTCQRGWPLAWPSAQGEAKEAFH